MESEQPSGGQLKGSQIDQLLTKKENSLSAMLKNCFFLTENSSIRSKLAASNGFILLCLASLLNGNRQAIGRQQAGHTRANEQTGALPSNNYLSIRLDRRPHQKADTPHLTRLVFLMNRIWLDPSSTVRPFDYGGLISINYGRCGYRSPTCDYRTTSQLAGQHCVRTIGCPAVNYSFSVFA